jgi:hypothetical protein
VLLNCKQIVNFDILKRSFLTIKILSKLPPSASFQPSPPLPPQSKRASYGTVCFCRMSVRNICVFLFVSCVFILRIANIIRMPWNIWKYFSSFGNFWPTPTQLYMLASALHKPCTSLTRDQSRSYSGGGGFVCVGEGGGGDTPLNLLWWKWAKIFKWLCLKSNSYSKNFDKFTKMLPKIITVT